ncbi:hypothetical protein CROQUDRAFT_102185 [Cronartium quercuum f. sp. fusiforme G11]|uniref:Uncharacterized protein n=1 Tax=Cronartium quercuum f. sp. fusiforme G11 TaxID=708437 RepID=A0A9P6N7Y6_9BASI|nr:hypothetical protein CROQUDRAFT_102185 [Cronartium quercuum f. sp. fusiforme G11]
MNRFILFTTLILIFTNLSTSAEILCDEKRANKHGKLNQDHCQRALDKFQSNKDGYITYSKSSNRKSCFESQVNNK